MVPTLSKKTSSEVFNNKSTCANNGTEKGWSNVTNSVKNEENTQRDSVKICKYFAEGHCQHHRNNPKGCKLGLHLSEQERNSNMGVAICFSFVNSSYHHSMIDCIRSNNGLCYHCAYGDCLRGGTCIYRHDPNLRYKYYCDSKEKEAKTADQKAQETLANEYMVCTKWMNNIWCDRKFGKHDNCCQGRHPGQCPDEAELCKSNKTCPPGCMKGSHQGLPICKPSAEDSKPKEAVSEKLSVQTDEPNIVIKMGSKPTPPVYVRKVKKVNNEPEYFYDADGWECTYLHSNNASTNSLASHEKKCFTPMDSSVKTNNSRSSRRSNRGIEVQYFDNEGEDQSIGIDFDDWLPNIPKTNSMQSVVSEITQDSDMTYQALSPVPSPLPVSTIYQNSMNPQILLDSFHTNNSPLTVKSNSSSKKMSITERKRLKKLDKIKEKEQKRKEFKAKTKKNNDDSDDDSDDDLNNDYDNDDSDDDSLCRLSNIKW